MKDAAKNFLSVTAGLACLGVAVCGITYAVRPAWYKNIRMEVTEQPNARVISVSAEGKISAPPDIAVINLSVVAQGTTVKQVTSEGNQKMTQVINAIKALGVDAKDIRTTSYWLNPDYVYEPSRTPRITGYRLEQQVTVKVRKLDAVEDVLNAGIQAGSNQVGQLSFDIDDPSKLKAEAREKAFQVAREKAKSMADSAGVRLGRVVTFSEGEAYQPPIMPQFAMERSALVANPAPAPSIEPGSQDLTVNVSVTYEIE